MASLGPQDDMMALRSQLMQQLGYESGPMPGVEDPKAKRAREMSHALRAETPGMPAYAEQARQTLGEDIGDVWNTPIPGSKTAMEGYNAVMDEMPWTPFTAGPKVAGKIFPEGASIGDVAEVLPGIGEASDVYYLNQATREGDPLMGTMAAAGLALPFVSGRQLSKAGGAGVESLTDALRGIDAPSSPLNILRTREGEPLSVFRGEHGPGEGTQTRGGSISFGGEDVARTYAESPNDLRDTPANPRVTEAYIQAENPVINTPDDPFIDMAEIKRTLGPEEAQRIARSPDIAASIENTGAWIDEINPDGRYASVADYLDQNPEGIDNLYAEAYKIFDDPKFVQKFREAGFDSAIHGGSGESALTPEYKVFDESQVVPQEVKSLARALRGEEVVAPPAGSRTEVSDYRPERFRTGEGYEPSQTQKAYKLFRTDPNDPDSLFPLFVESDTPVPVGQWLDAVEGPRSARGGVDSKLGDLAYRPGWHAGDMPIATHIGEYSPGARAARAEVTAMRNQLKSEIPHEKGTPAYKAAVRQINKENPLPVTAPDQRPSNQVWAEVELADDVNWQAEALRRAERNKGGDVVARTAHINDQLPMGGAYRYKTNPNMTGEWIIGGNMRVNRVLPHEEVLDLNRQFGVEDLPRGEDPRYGNLLRMEEEMAQRDGASVRDVVEGRETPANRKRVADMTDEELAEFGDQYGVNLRLTPPEKVIDPDTGAEYLIPGGLDRDKPFTLADQMFLKSQAYNAADMNPQIQTQMQRKMLDATTPKATGTGSLDDPATMFNRIMFGMQSPNTPLLTNQFMTTRMRVQTPEDIKTLGDMIDWEPGAKVDKARRMKADKEIGEKFGIHAAGQGGMGMRSSVDLTNIAEFAKLYAQNPKFFQRKADEPWQQFAERILNVQRGLSPKTASFGAVWQAPGEATISAMDRHMARNFRDVLMGDKVEGPRIRKQRVKLWNEQIDRIPEMNQKVTDAEKKAKAKPTAQNKAALKRAKANRDKLPPEGTKKVRSYNAILKQPGGEAWDADQIIVDSTKHVGGKYRLANGEINPKVPEHLRDLPIEPETFLSFGPTYTRMLQENERLAKQQGLDVFGEQWRFWDRIREQVEPHEAMNPDIQKLPRMPAEELNEAFKHQKQAGFHTSGRKSTGERYVSPFDWKKGIAFSAAGALPLSYALRQQRENEEEVY